MKIFLIGMPGSGKSTLGKRLADKLRMEYVDLDAVIEKQHGKSITEIFQQLGEEAFRKTESECLLRWTGAKEDFVMATGGGAPCFYSGIERINSAGVSIFLDVDVDEIVRRLSAFSDRPLLAANDETEKTSKLKVLLSARRPIYEKAEIILTNPSFHDLLDVVQLRMKSPQ